MLNTVRMCRLIRWRLGHGLLARERDAEGKKGLELTISAGPQVLHSRFTLARAEDKLERREEEGLTYARRPGVEGVNASPNPGKPLCTGHGAVPERSGKNVVMMSKGCR